MILESIFEGAVIMLAIAAIAWSMFRFGQIVEIQKHVERERAAESTLTRSEES